MHPDNTLWGEAIPTDRRQRRGSAWLTGDSGSGENKDAKPVDDERRRNDKEKGGFQNMKKMKKLTAVVMTVIMLLTFAAMPASAGVQANSIYAKVSAAEVQAARSVYNKIRGEYPQADISLEKMLEFRYTVSKMSAAEFAGYMKKIYAEGPVAVYTNTSTDGKSTSRLRVYAAGYADNTGRTLGSEYSDGNAVSYSGTYVWAMDVLGLSGYTMSYYVDHLWQYYNNSGTVQNVYSSTSTGGTWLGGVWVGRLLHPSLSIRGITAVGTSLYEIANTGDDIWVPSATLELQFNAASFETSLVLL